MGSPIMAHAARACGAPHAYTLRYRLLLMGAYTIGLFVLSGLAAKHKDLLWVVELGQP